MKYDFLSQTLREFCSINRVCELRLRADRQAFALINGEYNPVFIKGAPFITSKEDLSEIVAAACKNSVYAYADQIRRGYIAAADGVRIGLCGECVRDGENIVTIKNYSSLCVRFAREFSGSGNELYSLAFKNGLKNLLIIAPPAAGKTTLIRDLATLVSVRRKLNVLIVDENREIFPVGLSLAPTVDVLACSDKKFGFYTAVKTLAPDVIVADELVSEADASGAAFAARSGVKIICTVHGDSFCGVRRKNYLSAVLKETEFFAVLKKAANGGFKIVEYGDCRNGGEYG